MPDPHLLHAALEYLAHGWSLCPVYAGHQDRDKDPHHPMLSRTGYRDPETNKAVWRPLQDALPTEAQVRRWLSEDGVGIALVTGKLSGVVVLDFDGAEGEALLAQLGLRPHTRTPSGGYHVRVAHPGWRVSTVAWKSTRALPPGLDVRGDGGMSMLPPTWTSKGPYTSLRDPFTYADVSGLPEPVLRSIGLRPPEPRATPTPTGPLPSGNDRFPAEKILFKALEKIAAGDGRNDTGYWLARALHNNNYSYDEIISVGYRYIDHVGDTNTKGHREAYTLGEFQASTRQAMKLERLPWTGQGADGPRPARPRKATDALQDAWPTLTWDQRAQAARILAQNWRPTEPLERTMTFLRLCGDINDAVRLAVREGYRLTSPPPGDDALLQILRPQIMQVQRPHAWQHLRGEP